MRRLTSQLALLGSTIDYAGTFPPAALSLEKALEKAATFRNTGKHPWLMAKVVLPLSDIKKISTASLVAANSDGTPWLFAALGTSITEAGAAAFEKTIEWDLREIAHLNERRLTGAIRQSVVSYEAKLPIDSSENLRHELFGSIESVLQKLPELLRDRVDPYFELQPGAYWAPKTVALIESLAVWVEENGSLGIVPGIKVRTGGAVIPSSQELAEILAACLKYGIRFKATQGLHAPFTHKKALGFVNLFGALALGGVLGEEEFGKPKILECLDCEEANVFRFDENTFSWKSHRIETDQIEVARRRHGATFGSCSLDEPDEFLSQWAR